MSPHPRPRTNTIVTHLGVMAGVSAVIGLLLGCLSIPAIWALGFASHSVEKSLQNIPTDLSDSSLSQITRVVDARGTTIATFYDQNRVPVPLSQIAPIMQKALLDTEDARFYDHGALDLMGTLRAFLRNSAGNSTQGGSTITQQLAKMTAVDNATTQAGRNAALADTYQRKFQELRRAIGYEEHYSKNWILDRYMNVAYFGAGAYGIEAAAERYFSVPAAKLNTAQAALLAGLVQNPTNYDPTQYPDRARIRRSEVLGRMVSQGTITQAEANAINAQSLNLKPKTSPNGCASPKVVAAFYCDYVRRYLLSDPALGDSVADRLQLLNNGGLTIKTTMNLSYQRAANSAAQATVAPTDGAVGALAMVQPGTGNVLALAQSRPMGTDSKKGQTFLNYLVDPKYGDSAGFQPGSSFKLFTLSAALTQGLPSNLSFYAPQTLNIPQNQFQTCSGAYPNLSDWNINNSTGFGNYTMYTGTQNSVNTYFAQLERETGICQPYKLAKAMGIDFGTSNPQVPTFTLGVADVNPLQLAGAYATMAARGKYCAARPVAEILNNKGGVFKTYPTQCKQVVPANVADRVNDILSGVMTNGFGSALQLTRASAAKTGTTESNKAVWFNGYTPTVATSAMVAGLNSAGQPTTLNGTLLHGQYISSAHGSTVAGPMWALAMRAIENSLPNIGFTPPGPDPSQANLPSVEGQSVGAAMSILRAAGYAVARAGQVNSNYGPDTVAQISLGADLHTIYIYTSSGSPLYVSPPANPNPGPPSKPGKPGKPGNGNGGGNQGNGNGNGHGHGHGHG